MSAHEIIDAITLIMLYFQECVSNMTLPTLILVLPYDTAAPLLHMEIILKHLQSLTDQPTFMLIPYVNAANALFRQLLPMPPF